jgi:rhamnulose-1-phosphate aldolase/alcohol dehydrogenase
VKSLWTDQEAREFVDRYGSRAGEDLALRVYTSRLIGRDQDLVLHGGGNTSVKTTVPDILGKELSVVAVKGSGWGLVDIEPEGLPAMELEPLLRLRQLEAMSDEDLVNQIRIQLLDATAPTPSVETLLHAFLPRKFVDHTHADAILILTNQPDGEALIRQALGEGVVILPWILPGFPLSKAVADAFEQNPDCEGIVLLKHGIFTFGDAAKESYERMIDLVDRAEHFIQQRCKETAGDKTMCTVGVEVSTTRARQLSEQVTPVVRGALSYQDGAGKRVRLVGDWRGDEDLVAFSLHPDCKRLLSMGPLTPNHIIRTKARYLVLSQKQASDPQRCRKAVAEYASAYEQYFGANKSRVTRPDGSPPTMLDPHPRVVVVQGCGILAFGTDKRAAQVAGDIAEHTLRGKAMAEAIGSYTELSPPELFEMEYWSLEQAKLGTKKPTLLAGQVALVTGAAGAIGHGIVDALLGAGPHVLLTDMNEQALGEAGADLTRKHGGHRLHGAMLDVTDADEVAAAFQVCARQFGGVDIVVPNAGIAHVSKLQEMDEKAFKKVIDVNLFGTLTVLKEAAKVFQAQGTGGAVIVQASKNVFAPGVAFGAYSASKAGAHQLGKIAAMELAPLGVRVNMVNADAVFGDDVKSGLWEAVGPERMKSRGLDEQGLREYYRDRSLLGIEVTPAHVGEAVVFLAAGLAATTGATLTVDGGVAGAFPR